MKKGDTVYDIRGNEYEFGQALDDGGFVVYPIIETGGYLDREVYADDEPRVIDKVFAEPPTQKRHEAIVSLERKLEGLEKALHEKRAETQQALQEHAAAFEQFAQLEPLKTLQACVEGKITHVVKSSWGDVEILTPSDKEEQDGRGYFTPPFGLLTLFGNSRGDLQWQVNQYYDNSGSSYFAYPCTSLEMAQEKAREMFSETMAEADPCRRYLDNAIKLGIHIAPEYRQAVEDGERKAKQEAREKLQAELDALGEQ